MVNCASQFLLQGVFKRSMTKSAGDHLQCGAERIAFRHPVGAEYQVSWPQPFIFVAEAKKFLVALPFENGVALLTRVPVVAT